MNMQLETALFNKLAKPAQRALANAGIKTLDQLTLKTEAEIMNMHGIGQNAIKTIKKYLAENNLAFKRI
jgi:DNA-directed RNA polymerase alpha subunit